MPTLHELQTAFAGAVLNDDPAIQDWIADDRLPPEALLRIHRHNVLLSMLDVLEAAFPAARAILGEDAFCGAGAAYLRQAPPVDPCLFFYGAGFAAHLKSIDHDHPFLADLARLEWAVHAAGHAPDTDAVDISALAQFEDAEQVRLRLHPTCAYIRSAWPVDDIWRGLQEGTPDFVIPPEAPVWLEIRREGETVFSRRLEAASWQLRQQLKGGAPLGHAVEAALAIDPAFDLAAAFAELFAIGLVSAISPIHTQGTAP